MSSAASSAMRSSVVLIGPTLPYRGGIARHTTMLHRALARQSRALTISFSRQYPRWLYPGKSDREDGMADHAEPGVEYLIDSLNPGSWARAISRIRTFAPETVVFPWWHVYWTPCFAWMARAVRKMGIEVVFLCHNSIEHESARWRRQLSSIALSKAHRFVVHTQADRKNLAAAFSSPIRVHPHPTFDGYPDATVVLPRRARLELLFFGFVRPYKGLDTLLRAMAALRGTDVFLSIVGEFWRGEGEARQFVRDHGLADRVEFVARYVSDAEAAAYFARSDVVVLPYHSATGSGVIPLAYRYGKPVIATRTGGLPDVVVHGRTGLLIEPDAPADLAEAIAVVAHARVQFDPQAVAASRADLTWEGLAEAVLRTPAAASETGR
jgi:glycosyltransferase involved in cell wall biosynthesis